MVRLEIILIIKVCNIYTCSRNHHVAESETQSEIKVAETIWPNVKLSPKLVTNPRLKLSFIIDPFFNYIIMNL